MSIPNQLQVATYLPKKEAEEIKKRAARFHSAEDRYSKRKIHPSRACDNCGDHISHTNKLGLCRSCSSKLNIQRCIEANGKRRKKDS